MAASRVGPSNPNVRDGFDPLVPIQVGTTLPFFCIHGAGGNVLNFRDLATRLGTDQTFYGIQAAGVDGGAALETIEEMAALYLPSVLSVQSEGPYVIGGYSAGGVVAYELVQQLSRSGKKVALLVLLDTFAADVIPRRTHAKTHFKGLTRNGPMYLANRVKARLQRETDSLSVSLKTRFYRSQNQPIPFELRDAYMSTALGEAALKYRPIPYAGKVTLYRATEVDPQFRHTGEKLGWGALTPNMEVVHVPGNHDTLVYEPNVHVMISHLRKSLDSILCGA